MLFAEIAKVEPVAARNYVDPRLANPVTLPHGGIVMYCTPWCPDCKKAKVWLKACNLSYTEVDISKIPAASDQVRQWTGGNLTTPTFDINGEIVIDFNEARLSKILGL